MLYFLTCDTRVLQSGARRLAINFVHMISNFRGFSLEEDLQDRFLVKLSF